MRFTSAVSCGILRPSQRAFGTYLCVYRKEDDHTAPDRKSSGWLILSAMWLRRAVSPSRRVGRGRQILSFPSSCRPGQKRVPLRMVTQRHPFSLSVPSAGDGRHGLTGRNTPSCGAPCPYGEYALRFPLSAAFLLRQSCETPAGDEFSGDLGGRFLRHRQAVPVFSRRCRRTASSGLRRCPPS